MSEEASFLADVQRELAIAHDSWRQGNAGMGRVASRRAAGFAIRGLIEARELTGYGTNFMHHLGALADDESAPIGIRESAHRLAARKVPPEGFVTPFVRGKSTPMEDVDNIMEWVLAQLGEA